MESQTQEVPLTSQWFDSAQLLLSEKRTSLSVLRTGVGIFVVPLSVLGLLIATTKTYEFKNVMQLLIPVLGISTFLTILAFTLIIRSLIQLRHYDRMLRHLKESHPVLSDLMN